MQNLANKIEVPIIFLDTLVVFPNISLPLLLKKPESILALEGALHNDRLIIVALSGTKTGTICSVSQVVRTPDGAVKAVVEGLARASINKIIQERPYIRVGFNLIPAPASETLNINALIKSVTSQFKDLVNLGKSLPMDVVVGILNINNPAQLADVLAFNLELKPLERQEILELIDPEKRLMRINEFLAREIEILKTGQKLSKDTAEKLGKMSKEVYLREQLRTIKKELGIDKKEEKPEIKEYLKKLKKCLCPQRVKSVIKKELKRLKLMPSFSPEISYLRTYLDWLLSLPWKGTKKRIDINRAAKILDQDHYGLEKVKERILEYLAVQKRVGKIKGPILCFVGPPGTGKTSIGQSVARALGRKFVRISLGGVRDEAEIRGHRRTYIGALPGRIIQGIKNAGTNNPVFMLDEIDKIGNDFRGDPSAALLEALDPEQNSEFSDHYLEVPYDLSRVLFITTANILYTIPPALRDRLEIIWFSGFTQAEKFQIARKFLLPKLLKNHGLKIKELIISNGALKKVIAAYTYEAGVRDLERQLASLCRKVARKGKSLKIGNKDLDKLLGPEKYSNGLTRQQDEVGVATGLAWTQAGGETIDIEAIKMPGRGNLVLTGSLGRIMKESAQAAFSFAKSYTKKSSLKEDIHLHVPSGAIPKDGASAGIAMATTLVSLLGNKAIKREVAMTGEVTLRGQALEIGGVKEKVLAAYRAGAEKVILPQANKKNLPDIPKEIQKKLKFVWVKDMQEVLKHTLKRRS